MKIFFFCLILLLVILVDIYDMFIKFVDNINLGRIVNMLKFKKIKSLIGLNIIF